MQRPKEYTVQEVAAQLRSPIPPRLLDVREQAEWDIVHLEGGQLVTESLLDEILSDWPPDTPIVCYCHHGMRSLNAAAYLQQQGFQNVSSMRGGIDAWAQEIDPGLPRY
ncbi:MAG TPA: rhodanese-like domain-containing protein [bacterium]|nr:rhodanese-like domain-containing protein [bacterium]